MMLNPDQMTKELDRARAYSRAYNFPAAIGLYQELIQKNHTNCELYLELSSCLINNNQLEEAAVIAKNALLYATNNDLIQYCKLQLGHIYKAQQRISDAAHQFESVIQLEPANLQANLSLGAILLNDGYPHKALQLLSKWRDQYQHNAHFITNYSLALFECRKTNEAIQAILDYATQEKLNADLLSNALSFSNYTHARTHYLEKLKPYLATTIAKAPPLTHYDSHHNQSLRIGFVSADFYMHPVGYFLSSFLSELKNLNVSIYLYSNGSTEDLITHKIKKNCSFFLNITHMPTELAVKKIKSDQIDILIDLSGQTSGNRLDIFAQRAATIQASYLGYMDSTYTNNMDYLITDEWHIHANEQSLYPEKIIYLPQTRFCFAAPIAAPAISELPLIQNEYLTFGCFSNSAKFSDECLKLWAQVLHEIPDSRLKLRHKALVDPQQKNEILSFFVNNKVVPGRVECYGGCKYDSYLAAYSEVDVMLDTSPFSGATTTCESLWMGVPIITLNGDFPAARQTAGILTALGETAWIAHNPEHFITIAKSLHHQKDRLIEFRKTIRQNMLSSPLGNAPLFAQNFHQVLLQLRAS